MCVEEQRVPYWACGSQESGVKMTFPFVVVLWNDAWIDATEPKTIEDVEAEHKPLVVKTTGWILKEDEEGIQVASERYLDNLEHDIFRAKTFIPRQMIKSITPVTLTPRRARKLPKMVSTPAPVPSDTAAQS